MRGRVCLPDPLSHGLRRASSPERGSFLSSAVNFAATAKTSPLRGRWHRAAMTERVQPSPGEFFFYICLSISSIPHFCQRCKGGKSAWNQGAVHFFYNCLIFCPYTAYICMLCAIRRGTGAISLCKDALVFGMGKPVYYGYGKQQTHRKTSGAA